MVLEGAAGGQRPRCLRLSVTLPSKRLNIAAQGFTNHHFINIFTKASDLFRSRATIIMEIWKQKATRLSHVNHPINF